MWRGRGEGGLLSMLVFNFDSVFVNFMSDILLRCVVIRNAAVRSDKGGKMKFGVSSVRSRGAASGATGQKLS